MTEPKPFAIVDSNVVIYAMINNLSSKQTHEACLQLIEDGFKGKLACILAINNVIVVEVFTVLKRTVNSIVAESRVGQLLKSRRIEFLHISREECQSAIRWAKETNIPVNDALIGANAAKHSGFIYTVDEDHFSRISKFGIKIVNPVK